MPNRHLLLRIALALAPAAAPAGAAVVIDEPVRVRVYDTAAVPDAVKRTALVVASRALAPAPLPIEWNLCGVRQCGTPPAGREIVLRLVRSPGPQPMMAANAAALRAGAPLPLGTAFVDLAAGAGRLATVYVDRVEALARATGFDATRLLGYAIAHEVGHLLIGSDRHSRQGLMRATWSAGELRRNREADWMLTSADVAAIVARRSGADRRR